MTKCGFLQCFDTIGLVIWPVKIVPEMTYYVSSRTLNLYTTHTRSVVIRSRGLPGTNHYILMQQRQTHLNDIVKGKVTFVNIIRNFLC